MMGHGTMAEENVLTLPSWSSDLDVFNCCSNGKHGKDGKDGKRAALQKKGSKSACQLFLQQVMIGL